MKSFTKNIFRTIGISLLGAMLLSSCGGGGTCAGCTPTQTPAGDITLTLTAPNQYPAGIAVTAYLTMTNTSQYNATNLYYDVPNASNYTGTTITVANGASNNPCFNIAAGASCTFPAQIAAGSHPGSFSVTATPNGSAGQITFKKIWSSLKSELGLQAATLSLTANIGLIDLPVNSNSGANGITFLYSSTIAASESGDTLLSVVGVVNSAEAGAFNTINLTDVNGNMLNFSVLSGNSGNGLTNLANGSVVSFLLRIPAGATIYQFYAQTMENGTPVDQGSIPNNVNLGSATQGILVVQPTDFVLSANNNYESQVVTLSNIGNGSVTGLTIPTPIAPLEIVAGSNTCGTSLTPANTTGSSCRFTLKSNAPVGTSGQGNLTISSDNGSAIANYTYAGVNPIAGVGLTSGDNPTATFISNTVSASFSSQFTLKNTGNVSESNFTFTVPQYFTLSAGTTGTPCSISNNIVTTVLASHNDSCTLTLTYTNATVTNSTTANLLVDYSYNGIVAPQSSIGLTYQTVQAAGLLQVTSPLPLPYTFPSIRGNTHESQTQVFVVTNVGSGTASSITSSGVLQATSTYTIMPASTCGSSITSLAPGDSCQITVRFGPVASNAIGTSSKTIQVNYVPYPAAASQFVTISFGGTVTEPYAANIVLNSIVFTPAAYESGSFANPFQIESGSSAALMIFSYKNDSLYPASNFVISTNNLPGAYTVSQNNCNNLTLNGGASCTVVLSFNRLTAGALPNINLQTTLTASYSDDIGTNTGVQIYWINTSVYTTVYAAPSVTAIMSYESSGSNPITNVNAESDFYVVYKLTGGYNVAAMSYGVNLANAQGGTPAMSVYSPTSCTLSQNQTLCAIKLNAGGPVQNQSIGYTTTGSVTPSPTTSGNFNVNEANQGLYIFITKGTYNGDLKNGGGSLTPIPGTPASNGPTGGSAICNYEASESDSIIPTGLTFMAVVLDDTRTPCGSTGCGGSGAGYASDWPIAANTAYLLTDGTSFMTSNEYGVFEYTYPQGAILDQTGNAAPVQQFWIGMSGMLVESIIPVPAPIPGWTASSSQPTSWPYAAGMWNNTVSTCNNWTYGAGSGYSGYTGDNGDFPDSKYGVTGLTSFGFSDSSFPAGVSNNSFSNGVFPSRWNAQGRYSCNLGKPLICVQVILPG